MPYMKTKSKFSPFARYYVIRDLKNDFYWEKNVPYGYNYLNQAVFETRFVDRVEDATALTLEEGYEVMDRFFLPHISGGRWKADTSRLSLERRPEIISEDDAKLLKGTPVFPEITIPIEIHEPNEVEVDVLTKHSPEKIVEILNSIKKLSVDDGELDTWFEDSEYPEGIRGFVPGSFTRELLELIERHLIDEQDS